ITHELTRLNTKRNASNYDIWNLNGASQCERDKYGRFIEKLELVTEGEWELAIREVGAKDFFGGDAHGDEITTSIEVFVDGDKIDLNKREGYEANEFRIMASSDLYRDNTMTEKLELAGHHLKNYVFNKEGLTLDQ